MCPHAKGVGTTDDRNTGKSQELLEEKEAGKQAKLSIWESARSPSELTHSFSIHSALMYDMIVLNTEEPRLSKMYPVDLIPNQVVGMQKGTLFKN